jgi:hypothetical protein
LVTSWTLPNDLTEVVGSIEYCDADSMLLIRSVTAALIAVSVALSVAVPSAIGATVMLPSATEAMTSGQADMPCCPCCDKQDNFKSTACVQKCMTLTGAVLVAPGAAQPALRDGRPMAFASDSSRGVARKPPTHPPPA